MSAHSDIEAINVAAACWVTRRDAGLSEAETEEFGQWLAADARHGAAYESCARAWAALDVPLHAGGQAALVRELRARARRRHARRRRARRVKMAAAASCATLAIAFAALWQRPRKIADDLPPPGAQAAALVAAANPEKTGLSAPAQPRRGVTTVTSPRQRLLDDGSMVELKEDAVIDVRYDDAVRRVVLVSGEVHFQVKKGLSRPFVVVAGGIEVRAVGTAFAVGLGAKKMEVWVTAGRVAVEKPAEAGDQMPEGRGRGLEAGGLGAGEAAGAGASPSPVPCPASPGVASGLMAPAVVASGREPDMPASAPASAGGPVLVATLGVCERIVVETVPAHMVAAPVVMPVTPAEINKHLAWRVSRLEFSTTPLAEAVALINSHSRLPDGSANARLVLDESLAGLMAEPVSGYFYASDIETFVDVLNTIMGIESKRQEGDIVLFKRRN